MESKLLELIIQGGAVSIALLALWVLYKITGNHLTHNTSAMNKNTEAIGRLTRVIDKKIK